MDAEDFNPAFKFDAGDLEAPPQAPWEFSGACMSLLLNTSEAADE